MAWKRADEVKVGDVVSRSGSIYEIKTTNVKCCWGSNVPLAMLETGKKGLERGIAVRIQDEVDVISPNG